jgi:homoaconitase/3-isopropylmalate dehydratase large subunit
MKHLIENIFNKDYKAANESLEEEFTQIMRVKLHEMKKSYAAKMTEEENIEEEDVDESLLKVGHRKPATPVARANRTLEESVDEEEQLDENRRIKIVKLRIRKGKVQRRKRVSNVPGMTMRGGKLTRMKPAERRKRKWAAKRTARKLKSKKVQILRKRRFSMLKRKRLGF